MTVLTPSYNSGEFVLDALTSVHEQGIDHVEHIIIDGGSTDDSLQIVEGFRQQYSLPPSRLRVVVGPDRGQSDALNRGMSSARGDIIGWLNADDFYLESSLQRVLGAFEDPSVDALYGDMVFVDSRGSLTKMKYEHGFDRRILLYYGCYIPSTSLFFRRAVLDTLEPFDIDLHYVMDFDFVLHLSQLTHAWKHLAQPLAAFRWHGGNKSLDATARRQERLRVQRAHSSISSDHVLDFLARVYRLKRIGRKLLRGCYARQLSAPIGRDMRWFVQARSENDVPAAHEGN